MRNTLALAVFLLTSCYVASAQTSLEYSTLGSGTATSAAKSGSSAGNALGAVGKRLSDAVSPSATPAPAQPVSTSADNSMRSNRQQLEKQAQPQGCVTVHISTTPKAATLLVDHLVVAITPADLCLPVGKHILEVRSPGFRSWSQEVTLAKGETLALAPTLTEEKQTKEYKRTVTLTF